MARFASSQEIRQFSTILRSLDIDEPTMREMIKNATQQRTDSRKGLYGYEIISLIQHLGKRKGGTSNIQPVDADGNDKQRKRLISKFREMGYNTPDGKADMERINSTLEQHWSKKINDYDAKELAKIIGVVQKVWLPFYLRKQQD